MKHACVSRTKRNQSEQNRVQNYLYHNHFNEINKPTSPPMKERNTETDTAIIHETKPKALGPDNMKYPAMHIKGKNRLKYPITKDFTSFLSSF